MFHRSVLGTHVAEVSLEPHAVGRPQAAPRGVVPAVRTALTPFHAPIPIGSVARGGVGGPLVDWARQEEREHGLALGLNVNPSSVAVDALVGAVEGALIGVLAGHFAYKTSPLKGAAWGAGIGALLWAVSPRCIW